MNARLFGLLLCGLVIAGCAKAKPDAEAIQGIYTVVSSEEAGKVPEDKVKTGKVLIIDDDFNMYHDDVETRRMFDFTVNEATSPKQIDFTWDGLVMPGIYELSGDDLKICFDQSGKSRPTAFATSDGDQLLLLVLKCTDR